MSRLFRIILSVLLIVHVFAMVAMAASNSLHGAIHPYAGREDHDCAVSIVLNGALENVILPPVFSASALSCAEMPPLEFARNIGLVRLENRMPGRAPPAVAAV